MDRKNPHTFLAIGRNGSPRDRKAYRAQELAMEGLSLFQISQRLGVTKEWLRTYAGLDRNDR